MVFLSYCNNLETIRLGNKRVTKDKKKKREGNLLIYQQHDMENEMQHELKIHG